jgi:hypothetical protein
MIDLNTRTTPTRCQVQPLVRWAKDTSMTLISVQKWHQTFCPFTVF